MPRSATLLALLTIVLWSFLAYLGSRLSHVPPFLLVGAALTTAGIASLPQSRQWRIPLPTLLLGIGGLFGYHFLYFMAFRYAPAVETNMINYLWPLLIVLLSPVFLPGLRLGWRHLLGALLGLAGAALIVTGGRLTPDLTHLFGYALAAGAALIWASYSLLTRRLPPFPTAAVGGFCLASGLLSLLVHFAGALITGAWLVLPALSVPDALLLLAAGLGPMGLAFFTWDAALKRGDPRFIGALAYLTPLTSTIVLVLLDGGTLTWPAAASLLLILAGVFVSAPFQAQPQPKRTWYLTTCSKDKRKDTDLLPASLRYTTPRIAKVQLLARQSGAEFRIFSGEYGLLCSDDLIPWYDHLLVEAEVPDMALRLAQQLKNSRIEKLVLFTGDPAQDPHLLPYMHCLSAAAQRLNLPFEHRIFSA